MRKKSKFGDQFLTWDMKFPSTLLSTCRNKFTNKWRKGKKKWEKKRKGKDEWCSINLCETFKCPVKTESAQAQVIMLHAFVLSLIKKHYILCLCFSCLNFHYLWLIYIECYLFQNRARFSFMGGKGGPLWKQLTFRLIDQW